MLKVMKQKLPLIEDKIFQLVGDPDVPTTQLNRKIAGKQFKDSVGNVLFIIFSGIAMFATLIALSMLFAGVSNVALLAKGIVDAMFHAATFLPKIALAASIGYVGTKVVYIKFTEWEMRKALVKEKEVYEANAPRFTHSQYLTNQPVAPEINFTSGARIVMFSSNTAPAILTTDNELQVVQIDGEIPVIIPEADVQSVTPEGTVSARNSISLQ